MKPVLAALIVVALGLAFPASGQVADHLKCYKVTDPAPKQAYTADLGGLAPEPGCVVKVPAKMLCVESTKTNVDPTPPGGGPAGTTAGRFACYKVKCPKGALQPVMVTDQFGGTREMQPSAPKLFCAPVAPLLPSCTGCATSCGSCGSGICAASTLCGTRHDPSGCIDTAACTPSSCVSDADCGAGKACILLSTSSECCSPCP